LGVEEDGGWRFVGMDASLLPHPFGEKKAATAGKGCEPRCRKIPAGLCAPGTAVREILSPQAVRW